MARVEAPNKEYNGTGPGDAVFVYGVADDVTDEAALNYYRDAGYTVSGKKQRVRKQPEPPDPRDVTLVQVGTALRDAAVDPAEGDFLAPTNAGEANPHGSQVVSPEIHASGPAGIRPGEVFVEDPAKQDQRETEYAQARLVDGDTLAEAIEDVVDDLEDQGDLGLSDPGSAAAGRDGDTPPAGNAGREAWVTYVRGRDGFTEADLLDADGNELGRNELRDKYGPSAAEADTSGGH